MAQETSIREARQYHDIHMERSWILVMKYPLSMSCLTDCPEVGHTVLPVVLRLGHAGRHGVEGAGAQAGQGVVVVKGQHLQGVVESLYVVTRSVVLLTPVGVLHHV